MSGLNDHQKKLEVWLAESALAHRVEIIKMKPLTGGAIQENWRIDCLIEGGPNAGDQHLVLRSDAPSGINGSLSRSEEFKVLSVAAAAGVTVPETLWLCEDTAVTGRAFYVMRLVEGIALGPKVVKDQTLGGDREALGAQLGRELARIHSVRPPVALLEFLPVPDIHPALAMVDNLRGLLDEMSDSHPILEWGLRWAELHPPKEPELTLVHQDYRTGNYLVDGEGMTGILDWEFAGWGDPMSDLGWLCAECWRFSRPDLEVGGVSTREAFYAGYQSESGGSIDEDAVLYWEVIAHIRWAIIALQQAHRHNSGAQQSLELALTGRLLPDIERPLLNMTAPERWRAA